MSRYTISPVKASMIRLMKPRRRFRDSRIGVSLLRRRLLGRRLGRVRGPERRRKLREGFKEVLWDGRDRRQYLLLDRPGLAAEGPLPELREADAEGDKLVCQPAFERLVIQRYDLLHAGEGGGRRRGERRYVLNKQVFDLGAAGRVVAKRLCLGNEARH